MTAQTDLSLYRPNVGVALFHPTDGRVWLGMRHKQEPPYTGSCRRAASTRAKTWKPPPAASSTKRPA